MDRISNVNTFLRSIGITAGNEHRTFFRINIVAVAVLPTFDRFYLNFDRDVFVKSVTYK